jgi:predicted thioredoxin/glutaredoxin
LCDDAKSVLAGYLEYLPRIEGVDIDSDPELQNRFGNSIPVVEIDGEVRFRGRVDEVLLRRLIEATPPI